MPRPLVGSIFRNVVAAGVAACALLLSACSDEASTASPKSTVSAATRLPTGSGFDFWVLSLSWSPTYCEIEGENASRQQCASGRNLGFVVHGLWPQFESGWPEFCASSEPDRVPDSLVRDYLDIIPSAGLIGHQWRKHGTCSGLDQRGYLATTRAARQRVALPAALSSPESDIRIGADEVEAAFIEVNAGMQGTGIAVTCEAGLIDEVRICMTPSLEFRSCPEVDVRACRAAAARMPAPDG